MTESELAGPVTAAERIGSLDVLRGFALLGILTMNIGAFSMPSATYFNPTVWGSLDGLDGLIYRLTHVLADLKFMAIFSMLFGAGIVLMSERRSSAGAGAAGLHYRRMAWLLVFGLLHAHLLWYGDILVWYALCGSLAYLFRNLRPRALIVWGLSFIAVASVVMVGAGLTFAEWPSEAQTAVLADFQPTPEALAAEVAAFQGGFAAQMAYRSPEALAMETEVFVSFALWRVTGLMLLGMALYKLGVFSAAKSKTFYRSLIGAGVLVGIPVIAYGMSRSFAAGWPVPDFFFLGLQFNYWASLLVALGWIGLIMLLCQSGRLAWLQSSLAAVGRMAFTNYILQSVICTLIFNGHGLGLFGQVDRAGQALVVVGVCALQLWYSPLWLKRYRFGPLEWLWRSLVYVSAQRFRRVPQPA